MNKIAEQINKNFPFSKDSIQEIKSEEELLLLLSAYIQVLIDTDFARLINTLYKIDVSDIKIKRSLDIGDPSSANKNIAQLIIDREKEKIKTREEYSKKHTSD